ncbi:MAG: endolytic transglycosylase MltG, partial [Xanthomonadales bacterium]|nr:endolytic transglycosylase MltG [Xanthomonadales bacterium]
PAGLKPAELLARLASGDVIRYRFTIVEGWTVRQMLAALRDDPVLEQTLPNAAEPDWQAVIGADFEHPEGWFLPETYQFVRGDRDVDLLARAHGAMQAALDEAWDARADDLPVAEPYELLILASIVEKETGVPAERAEVAGVLVRRLQRGMRLEVDPSVIYGMGDAYDGNIRRADLARDTPYNTYTRHGLPPTPIALPGRAALLATAQPADGDALYFVADGSGGHTFSATYEEHQRAVRRWVELQRQRQQQP